MEYIVVVSLDPESRPTVMIEEMLSLHRLYSSALGVSSPPLTAERPHRS